MRVGSLFSGAGGLDMAVESVFGGRVVWQSEIDGAASKVLAHRFPGVTNLGDITAIGWDEVPPVDILCGGFPCQDVSAAGKRAGIKDGTRSGLWTVFADAIDALRPQWVVIENVRGLLSAAAHRTEDDAADHLEPGTAVVGNGTSGPVLRAAGAVLGDLADLGYDAQWTTVAAADVGAPHRRERVFIVAHSSGAAVRKPAGSSFAEETWQSSGDRSGDSRGKRTVTDGRQACGCGCRRIDHDWFANPDRFDDGGCRRCKCEEFWPAPQSSTSDGRHEGRPESAGQQRGFDAAVRGDGHVELLPTPSACNANDGEGTETWLARRELVKARVKNGNGMGMPLAIAVQLLPTPNASDGAGGKTSRSGDRKGELLLGGVVRTLLPTPNAQDGNGGKVPRGGRDTHNTGTKRQVPLTDLPDLPPTPCARDFKDATASPGAVARNTPSLGAVEYYLPTPSAADAERGQDYARANRAGSGGDDLVTAAVKAHNTSQWGKYAAAIHRWEQIVGTAPAPTEPNKNGNPRLSAAFSEWMMGWPAGWVTDPAIGISRNDQLRIVGNGVCPQQAVAALRFLLSVEVAA